MSLLVSPLSVHVIIVFLCVCSADGFVFSDERRLDAAVKRVHPSSCHPGDQFFDPVALNCVPCPDNSTKNSSSSTCGNCPDGHVKVRSQSTPGKEVCEPCRGTVLVPSGVCTRNDDAVVFPSLVTAGSLRDAVVGCRFNGNSTACQARTCKQVQKPAILLVESFEPCFDYSPLGGEQFTKPWNLL